MLLDWLAREGWIVLNWWLLITLAGAAVLPLCFRLLGGLPDKGYTLARAVGLLGVGFVFWLLASLGFLNNSTGSIVMAWLIMLAISLVAYLRLGDAINLKAWWSENKRVVIIAELLFALLFLGWAVFKAHQPEIATTEKPMELAFISGVMRSESFPPNDPWMAGYSISYYYFGYVMAAMLSMMSGVPSTVGFNMTGAMLFALTGLNAFGVVYNLTRSRAFRPGRESLDEAKTLGRTPAIMSGLLAMFFMIIMSNLQFPLIEQPYQSRSVPESYLQFWGTQDRLDYAGNPPLETNFFLFSDPSNWSYWWWFRASRVLTDYRLDGTVAEHAQPIDEFPAFSFLLGDNHPHVLALPFAVLALGLSLNLLLTWRNPNRYEILFYGICLGGLVFLNAWDGPIYMAMLLGVEALRRIMRSENGRLDANDWLSLVALGALLLLITLLAYLPFFISFRSQASGLLPNLIYPTLFRRFFIMFGPFVILLVGYLIYEATRGQRHKRMNWVLGLQTTGIVLVILVGVMLGLTLISAFVPHLRSVVQGAIDQYGGWGTALPLLLQRRAAYALTSIILLTAVVVIIARVFPCISPLEQHSSDNEPNVVTYPPAAGFALVIMGAGVVLALIPEFFYLRDNFGTRINTIFKFYYQAWIVFSVVAAYAAYTILVDYDGEADWRGFRWGYGVLLTLVIVVGSGYTALGIYSRTSSEPFQSGQAVSHPLPPAESGLQPIVSDGQIVGVGDVLANGDGTEIRSRVNGMVRLEPETIFVIRQPSLDGGHTMVDEQDYSVVACLNERVIGDDVVVAEAGWAAYRSRYARVGAITGIPIVMGWENHQRQWRGPTYDAVAGTRRQDIDNLYTELRWDSVVSIINQYDIDYIMYGSTERQEYGSAGEEKFLENLDIVCESGESRVFQVGQDVVQSTLR